MVDAAAAIVAVAAVLLIAAGLPKVTDPAPLAGALRAAGLPHSRPLVRGLALAEAASGLAALALPARAGGVIVGIWYAAFTVFVARALRRGDPIDSCGCFGRADTPPAVLHAVVTGLLALAGAAAAVSAAPAPWAMLAGRGAAGALGGDVAGGGVLGGVALAAVTGLLAFLVWQVLSVLPTTTPASVRSLRTTRAGGGTGASRQSGSTPPTPSTHPAPKGPTTP